MKNTQLISKNWKPSDDELCSDCCGHELYDFETPICTYCGEHCDTVSESELLNMDSIFDEHCEKHPDFNAALNGHPEFV